MKNDSKIKQKKILDFVKHNEYLFENLIMYDLLLPDSHKIVKINSFKENEDFGSTMKEEFIQFINNIDVNKKNIIVINIENDFEVLPIINDVKNKHIDASYVMYLYKNSKSIDEFYKECENLYFPKHQFNNLLLTMYNMVKEPNCISYIIDIEKKLNGVENITFITKEQNTLIDKVDVISDFIESAKKGDEYFCINSEKYTTVINAEIYKKLEKESRKEEKKLETNEINIDLNDR